MDGLNNPSDGARATYLPPKQSASFSCVVCHNRKVKCDRQEPCSNCAKAKVECVYRPPPPRRRKRGPEINGSVSQERGKTARRNAEAVGNASAIQRLPDGEGYGADPKKSGSGRMIMKDGNSIYLDK